MTCVVSAPRSRVGTWIARTCERRRQSPSRPSRAFFAMSMRSMPFAPSAGLISIGGGACFRSRDIFLGHVTYTPVPLPCGRCGFSMRPGASGAGRISNAGGAGFLSAKSALSKPKMARTPI